MRRCGRAEPVHNASSPVLFERALNLPLRNRQAMRLFLENFDMRGFQEIDCVFVLAVSHTVNEADDTRVDERFGAVDAREVGHVAGRAFGRNAMQGGLDDGIGLGVDGTYTVAVNH